jgi:hypothetical protein
VAGRTWSVVVVVGLLLASTTLGSCGGDAECDMSPGSGTIVGTLTAVRGTGASFAVASWTPNPEGSALTTPPVDGASVVVQYASDEITFLRVGRSYSVAVYPVGDAIGSGVHRAGSCSGGTVYADGKSIDTSVWSRSIVHRALVGFAVFVVAALALLTLFTLRNRRRLLTTRVLKERVE